MPSFESKKILLKHTFPDLSDELLDQMATVARVTTYPAEVILCHEDHHENVFYIIIEGEVLFTKRLGLFEHALRKGAPGDFFGEMALIDETIARSASVKTTIPTTVIEIDRAIFSSIVTQNPALVLSMTKIIIQRMRENDRQTITELRLQQIELEKAYEALNKLDEQRNIFLTTLAHELRTPLTSVMGYMQLVRSGLMKGPGLQLSLEKIGVGLDRMVSLLNDLLFLQQIEGVETRFRKIDLRSLIEETVDKARSFAQDQKANIKLDIEANLPEMMADPDGLSRALGHLIDNAIKFSPEGGDIEVNARHIDTTIEIDVIDQGVGIDPEFMPRLFKRFERDEKYGKHLFGGVGLGMPIVKFIVDSHFGNIEVVSSRGQGTKFVLHLPVDAKRATTEISVDDAWVDVPS